MKNWIRTIVFSLVLPGMLIPGFASMEDGSSIRRDSDSLIYQQILYSILDLQFDMADSLLILAAEENTGGPETPYLENYLEFLDALITGNILTYQDYLEASGKRIESIREGRRNHPGSLSALSTIHLQTSVLCALHNELFRAAKHLYYCNRYLRQGEEDEVGNPGKFRNRGILILVSASVPEEYQWLLKVFGLKGGIEEGFGYLEEYYTFASGAERLEAYLILDFADHTLNPDIEMPGISEGYKPEKVTGIYGDTVTPGNRAKTLYLYSRALADLGSGNSNRVIENLQNYHQYPGERDFPYLDLLLGEALLNKLKPEAEEPIRQFSLRNKGVHYNHYALNKLRWTYALKEEWENCENARQQVLQAGEPYLDADRQALNEASDTLPLNLSLLKARLLFDGGDYQGALDILDDSSGIILQNKRDSIEFLYRKARISDRLRKEPQAIELYMEVLENCPGQSWYFAPNSALHLGMIHESRGDNEAALDYYRKCLKINKSSYKQSIDYKARQGIRRLEKKSQRR